MFKPKTMMVREYRSSKALARDANKLATKGWELVSTTDTNAKSGGGRKLASVGFPILMLLPHASHVVATYRRTPS